MAAKHKYGLRPAFPKVRRMVKGSSGLFVEGADGMMERTVIAAMMMQGMASCSSTIPEMSWRQIAVEAVAAADALLEELNK